MLFYHLWFQVHGDPVNFFRVKNFRASSVDAVEAECIRISNALTSGFGLPVSYGYRKSRTQVVNGMLVQEF